MKKHQKMLQYYIYIFINFKIIKEEKVQISNSYNLLFKYLKKKLLFFGKKFKTKTNFRTFLNNSTFIKLFVFYSINQKFKL